MFLYTVKIRDEIFEYLSEKDLTDEELVEIFLTVDNMGTFYLNPEEFIDDYCTIEIEEAYKQLFLIITSERGYDTYDSAVYCAYTEKLAIEYSIKDMGQNYESNNAEFIGVAKETLPLGQVVASFNAG